MSTRLKNQLLVIFVLIISLSFAEIFCRFFYNRISEHRRLVADLALTSKFNAFAELDHPPKITPSPYTLFQLTSNYKGNYRTNSLGYRGDEFTLVKDKDYLRILTLGGSTTYGATVDDINETWPLQVQKLLNNYGYRNIQVINGGVESAASPEILSSWIYKHRKLKPDIVILNMGINDIWPILLTRDFSDDYSSFRMSQSFFRPPSWFQFLLRNSFFLRTIWIVIYSRSNSNVNGSPYAQAIDNDLIQSELISKEVSTRSHIKNYVFKNNFEYLIRLLQMDKIKIFVVFEPSMTLEQMKNKPSILVHNIELPWLTIKRNNEELMKEVSQLYGVLNFTIPPEDFKPDMFTDWYHTTAEGELLKAKHVTNGIIKTGFLTK